MGVGGGVCLVVCACEGIVRGGGRVCVSMRLRGRRRDEIDSHDCGCVRCCNWVYGCVASTML